MSYDDTKMSITAGDQTVEFTGKDLKRAVRGLKAIDKKTGKTVASSDALIDAEQERVDSEKAASPTLPGTFPTKGETDKRLRSFIERVERLEAEKAELSEDIKEVMGEAKANGYDPKIMRKILRLLKMDTEKRREEETVLELYKAAIGLD